MRHFDYTDGLSYLWYALEGAHVPIPIFYITRYWSLQTPGYDPLIFPRRDMAVTMMKARYAP